MHDQCPNCDQQNGRLAHRGFADAAWRKLLVIGATDLMAQEPICDTCALELRDILIEEGV